MQLRELKNITDPEAAAAREKTLRDRIANHRPGGEYGDCADCQTGAGYCFMRISAVGELIEAGLAIE